MNIDPNQNENILSHPVIDTNVIIDMVLKNRPRHEMAVKLLEHINKKGWAITIPCTFFIEFDSALKQEKQERNNKKLQWGLEVGCRINFNEPIPINNDFIAGFYANQSLPYLKQGDLILLAVSKKYKLPLITEDIKLYNKAKRSGLNVFKVNEYLNECKVKGTV